MPKWKKDECMVSGNGERVEPATGAIQERQGHAQPSNGHTNGDALDAVLAHLEDQVSEPGQPNPGAKYDSEYTEFGNAFKFLARFGEDFRYVVEWKGWIGWDGTRWKRDLGDVAVREKAKVISQSLWQDVLAMSGEMAAGGSNAAKFKHLLKFANSSCTAKGTAATISLARSALPIEVKQLDRHDWLLNVVNGTLDLRTGKLRKPRREDFLTKLCPTAYVKEAPCPTWERFLSDVFQANEELIRYVQRILGYGLTGDVSEDVLPILWGEGSNGKSTLVHAVMHVLGEDYGGTAPRELFAVNKGGRHPTEIMTLQGKRLMAASETEAGQQIDEALVKLLTGGDDIAARFCCKDYTTFEPTHKLLLSTNYKPQIKGTDDAIWRRPALIPFAVQFTGENRDKDMPKKLEAQREGILRWLVRGCLDWQEQGLAPPECVQLATASYRAEQDVVGRFIEQCCQTGEKCVAEARVLWQAFKVWAAEEGEGEGSQHAFGHELRRRRHVSVRVTKGAYRGRKAWTGLCLREVNP
jgi:putative DNA primase/helicase